MLSADDGLDAYSFAPFDRTVKWRESSREGFSFAGRKFRESSTDGRNFDEQMCSQRLMCSMHKPLRLLIDQVWQREIIAERNLPFSVFVFKGTIERKLENLIYTYACSFPPHLPLMLSSVFKKHHSTRRLHIHTPRNPPLRNLNQ